MDSILNSLYGSPTLETNHGSGSDSLQKSFLKRVNGSKAGEIIPLKANEVKIGRNPKSEITVNDPNVSRNHCIIKYDGNSWKLCDLGGINGTFADGKKLKPNQYFCLKDGDGISLGPPAESPAIFLFMCKKNENSADNVARPSSSNCASTSEQRQQKNSSKRVSDPDSCDAPSRACHSSSASSISVNAENPFKMRRVATDLFHSDEDSSDCSNSSTDSLRTRIRKKNLRKKKSAQKKKKGKQKEKNSESLLSDCKAVVGCDSPTYKPLNVAKISKEDAVKQLELMHEKLNKCKSEKDELASALEECKTKELILSSTTDLFKKFVDEELVCTICAELFIKPLTLNCSHTFCHSCIEGWKRRKKQCPICREKITHETRSLVLDNFICKAVEQLDQESQNKRKDVIKEREAPKAPPVSSRRPTGRRGRYSRRRPATTTTNNPPEIDSLLDSIPGISRLSNSPVRFYIETLMRAQAQAESSDDTSDSSDSDDSDLSVSAFPDFSRERCHNCGEIGHWEVNCPYM